VLAAPSVEGEIGVWKPERHLVRDIRRHMEEAHLIGSDVNVNDEIIMLRS
jgi:hypothetical protein